MKSAFSHLAYPVYSLDPHTELLTSYNAAATHLAQAEEAQLTTLVSAEDQERLLRLARRASSSKYQISSELSIKWKSRKGGDETHDLLNVDYTFSLDEDSGCIILSIMPKGLPQAELIEEQRSSSFLQGLLDLTQTLFFVVDNEQHLVFANRATWDHIRPHNSQQKSGVMKQNLKLSTFVSPKVSDVLKQQFRLCAKEKLSQQVQIEWPNSRHERRIFQALMQPLIGVRAETEQILVLCSDITELVDAYEEQSKLQHALDQSQRLESIGQMAGNIAHDFNGFLTVIISSIDLLGDSELESDDQELIEGMSAVCHQARHLIQDLLSFSRAQMISEQIGALESLDKQLRFALPRLSKAGTKVSYHSQLNHLHALPLSEAQCAQIFVNLVNNAIEAMPEDRDLPGEVKINCSTDDQMVYWSVEDNGIGIPPNLIDEIFEPFFTTKRDRGGTGLGLASTRALVMKAGGDIDVDSIPNKGTRFVVKLPAKISTHR